MLSMLRRPPIRDLRASHPRASCWLPRLALGIGLGVAASADAGSITGVCPDGSVYVVRDPASIPCRESRRVEPHEVPPLRPENLPRPYLWNVYREKRDENNPYNLVDRAAKVRGGLAQDHAGAPAETKEPAGDGAPATPDGVGLPQVASAPPTRAPAASASPKAELALTDGEVRDLFYLVELSQQQAPATFATQAAGQEALRVSFAHSQAFETRARSALRADGRVVLWTVQPKQHETFHPNFTFVQGQTAYRPQASDPRQLGVLVGKVGALERDELVLGYAIVPGTIDLARPVDLYWDDRRLAVTFQP
jgi:hypothetical protein